MSLKKNAAGGRRDDAEPAIVAALNACGVQTWQLSGKSNPDLLCRRRGRYLPLEIKTGNEKANANQQDIPWPIVRTVAEALAVVNAFL